MIPPCVLCFFGDGFTEQGRQRPWPHAQHTAGAGGVEVLTPVSGPAAHGEDGVHLSGHTDFREAKLGGSEFLFGEIFSLEYSWSF